MACTAVTSGWWLRIASLLVTIGGIFVFSGLIASGVDRRLEELRKGRSPVIESDHTLILGWSPTLFPVITELVAANGKA